MTKRIGGEQPSAMTGGMTREDRKNQEIARMIERQECLRKKREDKNKLKVLNQKNGTSSGKNANGSSGQRKQKLMQQTAAPERKPETARVQIHVVFSDNIRASNASNRYFIERKQTVEERQRQEQEELWTRLAQAQFINQRSGQLGQGQGMGYYINTGGDTGGNYEAGDDYTGSSYLSSASKRQRVEDWGPQTQTQQMHAQQALLIQQQQNMMLHRGGYSNIWEPQGNQLIHQQHLTGMPQAVCAQGYNYNQPLEEQSPASSQQMPLPTSETPFVNPISAEESSAGIDKKSESADLPIQIKVDIGKANRPQTKALSEVTTGVTVPRQISDEPVDDAQAILELTKKLQNKLHQKRIQAPPPADTAPEVNQTQTKISQS